MTPEQNQKLLEVKQQRDAADVAMRKAIETVMAVHREMMHNTNISLTSIFNELAEADSGMSLNDMNVKLRSDIILSFDPVGMVYKATVVEIPIAAAPPEPSSTTH